MPDRNTPGAESDEVTPRSILSWALVGERPYDQAQTILDKIATKGWTVARIGGFTHSIRGDFCGQQQPHGAHVWTAPVPFGSASIAMPRQCAGLSSPPETGSADG